MTPTSESESNFHYFSEFFILIPILAKIDFLTVLESIPKSDIYDSDPDSSKKRNRNTSSWDDSTKVPTVPRHTLSQKGPTSVKY